MPQSQEKTPEQTTELPNPELNPLLNPTLGRHLGRWAQVYFTSPPEKREEAVEELLRELQGQPSFPREEEVATLPAEQPPAEAASPETIRIVEAGSAPLSLQCAECGHPYTFPQRFCGMCGAALEGERTPATETVPQPHLGRPVEPLFIHADLPSLSPVNDSVNPPARLLRHSVASREKPFRFRFIVETRALRSGCACRASDWNSFLRAIASAESTGTAGFEVIANQCRECKASDVSSGAQGGRISAHRNISGAKCSCPRTGRPRSLLKTKPQFRLHPPRPRPKRIECRLPATPRPQIATQPTAALNPANGTAELAMAEDFLSGKTHPRNSEEAAKYLWRAVGKENPTAILLLSDMYQAGDGVPKSCDQARLLLSAAAKKGVPQAAAKLGDLLRSGCPK